MTKVVRRVGAAGRIDPLRRVIAIASGLLNVSREGCRPDWFGSRRGIAQSSDLFGGKFVSL